MVTQCPNCGTRFRIAEGQLARAGGKARCGACLQVFAATDNLGSDDAGPGGAAEESAAEAGGAEAAELPYRPNDASSAGRNADSSGFDAKKVRRRNADAGEIDTKKVRPVKRTPPGAAWVRWALVTAIMAMIVQVAWYLWFN